MAEVGLNIKISADVLQAVQALGGLNDNLVELATEGKGSVESVALALNDLRQAAKNAGNTTELSLFNRAIRDLSIEARNLRQVGLKDTLNDVVPAANTARGALTSLGLNAQQTRIAFLDSARAISGQGFTLRSLGSQLALLGPGGAIAAAGIYGLYEILNKTTDAEQRAASDAKKLKEELINLKSGQQVTDEATGSEAGNIARVRDLAAAIQDTNRSYKERQNALIQLRETNKAYFGDLTLEANSLATLSARVNEYSQALVAEAVVKSQVEAISKLTSSLLDQVRAEDKLRLARDQANEEAAKPQASSAGNVAGGGADVINNAAARAAVAANDAFEKQKDVVFKLREQIAIYNGDLNNAIDLQLKFKPLQDIKGSSKDGIKSLEELLNEIVKVKKELATPSKEPLFKQELDAQNAGVGSDVEELFKLKIAKAIEDGNKIGTADSRKYAAELAGLYQEQLNKIRTPNLASRVQGIVNVTPDDVTQVESKIEKSFGKGIKLKIPIDLSETFRSEGFGKEGTELLIKKTAEDTLNNLPRIQWTPAIQVKVDRKEMEEQLGKQTVQALNESLKGIASSAFDNFGESIGKAIASGKSPIEAAGKSILQSLGDLMEQIGKALIQYGIVKEGLDAILTGGIAIPGVAAIGLGIAAVALGALVKQAFKPTAFAEGGIVTGPTYSLIGEAGPEAVFPLSKLNDFVKSTQPAGGPHNIGGEFTIHGNSLKLVLARTNKMQGLV